MTSGPTRPTPFDSGAPGSFLVPQWATHDDALQLTVAPRPQLNASVQHAVGAAVAGQTSRWPGRLTACHAVVGFSQALNPVDSLRADRVCE